MELSAQSVSVVIPCYNASRFLRETLDSAIGQTHPPLEILVIDDGSTDDSANIARSYGPPVRVISQPNQGESVARNRGIDEARGEWIAFLDADDVWLPEKLARQLAAVDSDEVVCVHTNLYYFGDRQGLLLLDHSVGNRRYELENLAKRNAFATPSTMLVRRSNSPRFPVWTQHAEDWIYCLELVEKGQVRLVDEPLVGYRQHSTAQSRSIKTRSGWHRSMIAWLELKQIEIGQAAFDSLKGHHCAELLDIAWELKWQREWSEFVEVRAYLAKCDPHSDGIQKLMQTPLYPPWMYSLADRMRSLGKSKA